MASWFGPGAPSRRVTGVLAAAVLAGGIVAGGSLGPAPASSLAGGSTIVQRALAALTAQASGGSSTSASASSTQPADKAKGNPSPTPARSAKAASSESSTSNSSASESGASGTSSSKESSSEGSSSEGSGEGERTAPGTPVKLPPIKHVWLIVLGGSTFADAMAATSGYPYLTGQLIEQGTLLSSYSALDGYELAGDAALLPGGVGASLSVISEPGCGAAPAAEAGAPCPEGAQASPQEADAFVQRVAMSILASPAYRENGLIVITFAPAADSAGAAASTFALQPAAGVLLLSPLLHGGVRSSSPFDPLSPRTSLETIFAR